MLASSPSPSPSLRFGFCGCACRRSRRERHPCRAEGSGLGDCTAAVLRSGIGSASSGRRAHLSLCVLFNS